MIYVAPCLHSIAIGCTRVVQLLRELLDESRVKNSVLKWLCAIAANSKVRGYHIYKEIWPNPYVGESITLCKRYQKYTRSTGCSCSKSIWRRVEDGHVPRQISPLSSVFIRRGGCINCVNTGPRCYLSDLPQGGLEVPCHFIFNIKSAEECEQLHKHISDSLSKTCHSEILTESDMREGS